jgi:hypothetical protein
MNRSAPRSIDQYLRQLREELGILLLTLVMHVARGVGRLHAMYAKALLVAPAGV